MTTRRRHGWNKKGSPCGPPDLSRLTSRRDRHTASPAAFAGFPATQPLPGNSEVAEIVAERFSDVAGVEPEARQPITVRPKAPVPFGTRHIGRHTGLRGYDVEIEKAVNSSHHGMPIAARTEERRGGKEWVSTCRSRWSRD